MQNLTGKTIKLNRNARTVTVEGGYINKTAVNATILWAHVEIAADQKTAKIWYEDPRRGRSMTDDFSTDEYQYEHANIKRIDPAAGHGNHEYFVEFSEQPNGWMPRHWLV